MSVNDNFEASKEILNVFSCPPDYRPSRFFLRYKEAFVPPIYLMNLNRLKRGTGADTPTLWGWTFDQLADGRLLRRDAPEFGRYSQNQHKGSIPCAASKVSEVFKSAYLRVLEALCSAKLIDTSELRGLAGIVCPNDLSLWDIGSVEEPDWWPRASAAKEQIPASVDWERTEHLALKNVGDEQLVYAEGPLLEQKDDMQSVHFTLMPFAYRVIGREIPSPEDIFFMLNRSTWSIGSTHRQALSVFQAPLQDWIDEDQDGIQADDLLLLPMLAHVETININCWQSWRGHNPLKFPSKHLSVGGSKSTDNQSWSLSQQGEVVFKGLNWLKGPQLRLTFQYGLCGQFAVMNRSWLNKFLDRRNLKLAFVLKHDYRVRESEHREYSTSSFTKLLNFSSIVGI